MSYQFDFASSEKLVQKVTVEELDAVRKVLLASSFELLEIKSVEDQRVSETWKQSQTNKQICLEIIDKSLDAKAEEPATLQNVVDELVDLWIELRAIRNNTLNSSNEDETWILPHKLPTSLGLFWQKVGEQRERRSADPEAWSFQFKHFIDEYICAYNSLDPTDRKAITH
jgi:hypothetical protein